MAESTKVIIFARQNYKHENSMNKILPKKRKELLMILIAFLVGGVLSIVSCDNSLDSKIRDCFNANDTIINLCDLYPEEWDTVYYFSGASLDEIEKRVGPVINHLWVDNGDKMLILSKYKKVIYYQEWDMYNGQELKGAFFCFKTDSTVYAIPRKDARFLIRKRDSNSYWLIYQ